MIVRPAICVIPARGGSKGIPRKNLLNLNGSPLVVHAIRAALGAKLIGNVYVSSDDLEIGEVSEQSGAHWIRRPVSISLDRSSSEDALRHALNTIRESSGELPDLLVFLQCTSPLLESREIDGAIKFLRSMEADCCFSGIEFRHFLWRKHLDGTVGGLNHSAKDRRKMRQEVLPDYLETGAIYVMRTQGFLKSNSRFFGKTVCFVTPKSTYLEVDDEIDVRIARALLSEQ